MDTVPMIRKTLRLLREFLVDVLDGYPQKPLHYLSATVYGWFFGGPKTILIEPIAACNLHCEFCSIPPKLIQRNARLMTLEQFKKLAEDVKPFCRNLTLYFGGESLLHPHLPEMVAYASKNGFYTSLSTNCTLLSPEISRKLIAGGLDHLLFSLDGLSKESLEGMRIGANYEQVMDNVQAFFRVKKELGKAKPFAAFQLLVSKLNQHEVQAFKEFAAGFGASARIRTLGLPTWVGEGVDLNKLADKYLLEPDKAKAFEEYEIGRDKPCRFDQKSVVFADGRVAPCCFDVHGKHALGNVYQKSFSAIWNSQAYRDKRPLIIGKKLDICEGCDLNSNRTDAGIQRQYSRPDAAGAKQ